MDLAACAARRRFDLLHDGGGHVALFFDWQQLAQMEKKQILLPLAAWRIKFFACVSLSREKMGLSMRRPAIEEIDNRAILLGICVAARLMLLKCVPLS